MEYKKYYDNGMDQNVVQTMSKKFNLSPKVMALIVSRGYTSEQEIAKFLRADKQPYNNPLDLNGMNECVQRILKAKEKSQKIVVFGDYDVDGISATTIMVQTLRELGIETNHFLPNRFEDGYGVTNETIEKIKNDFLPDLIITVDCGITAKDEVEYAKSLGIDIIVTDHHEIPEILPNCIVIDPKCQRQKYPFSHLCGTGVAFKISQALLGTEKAEKYCAIAALATIADIVPLKDENRTIVMRGLQKMEDLPLGIKSLMIHNKIQPLKVTASDISFKIAPRLNASGRMGDANDSLQLYFEQNPTKIKTLIQKITDYNVSRQDVCSKVYDDCKKMLENKNMADIKVISLYSETWDQGVLGIVCSRLLEEYNRPVFLFAKIGNEMKGSARSLPEINVHNLLSSLQDILMTFGGHSVAAGLTIEFSNYQNFIKRLNSFVLENMNDEIFSPVKYYDDEITLEEITEKFVNDLDVLEPCGCENSKPIFLIQTKGCVVAPIKKYPTYANICIGKKLQLIYYNYTKNNIKLRLSEKQNFLFEFQKSFSKSVFKGLLKNFECGIKISQSAINYIDAPKLLQLSFSSDEKAFYEYWHNQDLLGIVSSTNGVSFGTAFVSYSYKYYDNFINQYDTKGIHNLCILDSSTANGINSILLCPQTFDWAKNYSKIVFLDAVVDTGIISKINSLSRAKVYIPADVPLSKALFQKIDFTRSNMLSLYSIFLKLNMQKFIDLYDMYGYVKNYLKCNVSVYNFYFAYHVFKELRIVSFELENGLTEIKIDKSVKTDLHKSKTYNLLDLITQIQ